jgi:hypothetical protein
MKTRTFPGWLWLLAAALMLALLLGGAGTVLASDIRDGDSIVIGSSEVIDDDLLLFGNTVVMNGTVNGDLLAFGNDITINGTVNGSAMLGGQTIRVTGTVRGTLYSGGNSLVLAQSAVVERNVMFGGNALSTLEGSRIRRDLFAAGAQAAVSGVVGRDVNFAGQALELNGQVTRNVRAEVASPNQVPFTFNIGGTIVPAMPPGLRVGRNANIGGQLSYASSQNQAGEILVQPGGGIAFEPTPIPEFQPTATVEQYGWLWARVRDFVTVLILGLLALWLLPKWVQRAVEHAQTKPLASTAWGFLVLFGGLLFSALLLVVVLAFGIAIGTTTLGGLAAAIFGVGLSGFALYLTIFFGLVLWGAKVVVSSVVGRLLLRQFAPSYAENRFIAFALGLVLFEIVAAIPFLGPVLTFFVVLFGLGGMWYVYYQRKGMQVSPPRHAPMPA